MPRAAVKIVLLALVLIAVAFFERPAAKSPSSGSAPPATGMPGDARQTWGRPESLADHFARHGSDFGARSADDYAAQAAGFLERARREGFPAKRDADGSLRVFDPATGTFGAYNRNGTAKTFFKPGNAGYFDRQPGTKVDLRTGP